MESETLPVAIAARIATKRLVEHQHRLTTYDAAYLELAIRRSLPLASLDEDLRRAASARKIQLLGK
jgi:predicted nucleic acid-binding protein